MNLQDFISQTLVQIAHGIKDANESLTKTSDSRVNPRRISKGKSDTIAYGDVDDGDPSGLPRIVETIEFDVAVTVEEGTEARGGIGITVGAFSVGSTGKLESGQSSLSRIRFSIPMVFPTAAD